jgi:hypothetical protein
MKRGWVWLGIGLVLVSLGCGQLFSREAREKKQLETARKDLRVLWMAMMSAGISSYFRNPTEAQGLQILTKQKPCVVQKLPEDVFGIKEGDLYQYATDARFGAGRRSGGPVYYWVIWTVGPRGSCKAFFIDGEGTLVVHDGGPSLVIEGVKGQAPGVPKVNEIAYATNASMTHVFARDETSFKAEEWAKGKEPKVERLD